MTVMREVRAAAGVSVGVPVASGTGVRMSVASDLRVRLPTVDVAARRTVRADSTATPIDIAPKASLTFVFPRPTHVLLPPASPGLFGGHDGAELLAIAADYGVIAVELLVLYVLYGWLGRVLGFDGLL
jgi:hypothetical protein